MTSGFRIWGFEIKLRVFLWEELHADVIVHWMKQVFFFPGKDINEDTGKCEAAEDTNEDLDVGEATVVDDDVPSEEIAVAGDVAVAAVSVHDLDKDELKWDDQDGWVMLSSFTFSVSLIFWLGMMNNEGPPHSQGILSHLCVWTQEYFRSGRVCCQSWNNDSDFFDIWQNRLYNVWVLVIFSLDDYGPIVHHFVSGGRGQPQESHGGHGGGRRPC